MLLVNNAYSDSMLAIRCGQPVRYSQTLPAERSRLRLRAIPYSKYCKCCRCMAPMHNLASWTIVLTFMHSQMKHCHLDEL